jgi:hypothetical protein
MQMQVAEDVRERWETSDNPVVQKIQEYVLHPSLFYLIVKFDGLNLNYAILLFSVST